MSASEASIAEQRSSRFGRMLRIFVNNSESSLMTGNFGPLPLAQCYSVAAGAEALCTESEESADGAKVLEISRTQSSAGL